MTKIHNMSIIFAAVGLKLTCGAILLSWFWPERAFIWFCPTPSAVLKIFDHWPDVLICLLINTSAPSHWLKSAAWPVGPVQCPDYAHTRASSVLSSKDNRTVILTRQDFLPDRTADGDLLFTFSPIINILDLRKSLSSYLKFGSRYEDLPQFCY